LINQHLRGEIIKLKVEIVDIRLVGPGRALFSRKIIDGHNSFTYQSITVWAVAGMLSEIMPKSYNFVLDVVDCIEEVEVDGGVMSVPNGIFIGSGFIVIDFEAS